MKAEAKPRYKTEGTSKSGHFPLTKTTCFNFRKFLGRMEHHFAELISGKKYELAKCTHLIFLRSSAMGFTLSGGRGFSSLRVRFRS